MSLCGQQYRKVRNIDTKHDTSTKGWSNLRPVSATSAQHLIHVGWMCVEMKVGKNVSFTVALSEATFAEFCSAVQCGAARHGAAFCRAVALSDGMRRGTVIKLKH